MIRTKFIIASLLCLAISKYSFAQPDLQDIFTPLITWEKQFVLNMGIESKTSIHEQTGKEKYRSSVTAFDKYGNKVKIEYYKPDGTLSSLYMYEYNSVGKPVSISHKFYNSNKSVNIKIIYDANGSIKNISGENEGNPVKWSEKDKVLTLIYRNGLTTQYYFNSKSQVIAENSTKTEDSDSDGDGSTQYEYNKDGKLISFEFIGTSGDKSKIVRNYTYNEHGLLVKEEHNADNEYTHYTEVTEYKYSAINGIHVLGSVKHSNDYDGIFAWENYEHDAKGIPISMADMGIDLDGNETTYSKLYFEYKFMK